MMDAPAGLKLLVSPQAGQGERIQASVEATNVSETVVTLHTSDTVVISQPHAVVAGSGTFKKTISWVVEHVQEGKTDMVEITVSDGRLAQTGLCRIVG